VTSDAPKDDLIVGDRYYILASSVAADLPKLVLKHGDAFLVADRRGDFLGLPGSEFGFYHDGTRFLHQLELRLHHQRPLLLNAAVSEDGLQCAIDLTNPDILGDRHLIWPGRALRISRLLTLHENRLSHTLTAESFARETHDLVLTFQFSADFADVFEVRGSLRQRRGSYLPARRHRASLELSYHGLDHVIRTTYLSFNPPPEHIDEMTAEYRIPIPPGGQFQITLMVTSALNPQPRLRARRQVEAVADRGFAVVLPRRGVKKIETHHELFNEWIDRGWNDLRLLLTETPDGAIPYAGIPWYVAPFGRDSLLTALQVLPFEPEVARGTLCFLARHQALVDDAFTDQEPGKIFHELRRGEMAACREIPFIPYYGSVDATPLYLMLLAEYLRWTGGLDVVRDLWPAAERALTWMLGPGVVDDTGYLSYQRRSPLGLDNQGWKDSHDAIMHASGELAKVPIALVEVQGYQYAALLGAAEIAGALGQAEQASALRLRADRLRQRFEVDFWLEEHNFYALALDGEQRACRVISSNPGHCLWTGIVSEARAKAVTERLMAADIFTGWGLRTLSSSERLYNPMSYHNGSVWPHDTAIAALGMRRYGLTEPFLSLATGLFEAALHFEGTRMPELFCGFPRSAGQGPIRYPAACAPQAWSAAAVFQLVSGMLGLVPDAKENRLTLDRPCLPSWLGWIELRGLRLHRSSIDLRVSQGRAGAAVELLARDGDVEVIVRR